MRRFFTQRNVLIGLGLVAGVAAVGAIVASTSAAVTEEARFRIRDMFEVGPDCEWIRIKSELVGDADAEISEAEANELLARADSYYFVPMVKAGAAAGITEPQAMAIFILEDMFPACKGHFPPDSLLDASKQIVWFAVWSHVTALMEAN